MIISTLIFGLFAFLILTVITLVFIQGWRHKQYFKKRGIPYLGSGYDRLLKLFSGNISLPDGEFELYAASQACKSPLSGYSDNFIRPGIYINDLDLIKTICIKNFDHFTNRRSFTSPKGDILFQRMLLLLEDDKWKTMRSKLSPTFTTGKIRRMFAILESSSSRMCNYIKNTGHDEIDISEMYSKFAMDVIANLAFGVDSKSFEMPVGKLTEFEEMGMRLQFRFSPLRLIKFIFIMSAPQLADMFGIQGFDIVPQIYFKNVIKTVIKHRRDTGERKEDFLQLMMDLQEGLLKNENSKETLKVMTGTENDEDLNSFSVEENKLIFEDEDIVANCVLFFTAGYDTLQSLLVLTAYALALNQQVQEKLSKEVEKSLSSNGGKFTYDSIHEMSYLDMFINETLRYYSPATRAERVCTKDFPVPGTNILIEKGTLILIPIIGVHRDPQYYQDPEKFIPERFSPEEKSKRHACSFLPFGQGPRNCIGMRFALTEVKVVIASLIHHFKIEPCAKTQIPIKWSNSTILKPANNPYFKFTERK